MNGHKPMKGLFKEKKKIKKKKSLMAEKLSQLKNGTGKQKVKKEALKNKAKSGKKDKANNKVLNLFKFFTVLGFFMFLESCLYKCVLVFTLEIVFYLSISFHAPSFYIVCSEFINYKFIK